MDMSICSSYSPPSLSRGTRLSTILADPEVTANLYGSFAYPYWEGELKYIFAVTSGSPSTCGKVHDTDLEIPFY